MAFDDTHNGVAPDTDRSHSGGMKVNALDHVNIIATDLEVTARFYADVFGLERRDAPPPLTPANAQWMYDGAGRAIFHVNSRDCPRTYPRDAPAGLTGAVHHIALNCSGHGEMIARLEARQLDYRCNTVPAIGLKQIFVLDPNSVLLELNFFEL